MTEDPLVTRDIVDAIRAGDRSRFDDLFQRVGGKVHVYILARAGARLRSVVEPEDILQEVYTQAFTGFDDFVESGSGSMARWLIGIAANQVRAHYKYHFEGQKRDAGRNVPIVDAGTTAVAPGAATPPAPDDTPSRIIARDEVVLKMAAALGALGDEERELVLEHVYEEKSLRELAKDRDVPHTTLAYRLGQALDTMRAHMERP